MEAMNERVKNVSWEDQYKKMTDPIIEKKETFDNEEIQFTDDDVIINGKSTKELAKVAAQTNARIVEMFKLLVPVIDGADLSDLTYADIESEFPFSVQLDVSKKIAEVISPGYEETRKN
jgi:DNA polymerase II large subunit